MSGYRKYVALGGSFAAGHGVESRLSEWRADAPDR